MALIMSFMLTYFNLGFIDGFVKIWLAAYIKALMVAYPVIFLIAPLAAKLTHIICSK